MNCACQGYQFCAPGQSKVIKIETKCTINVLHLSHPSVSPLTPVYGEKKLSSIKAAPGGQKVADHSSKGSVALQHVGQKSTLLGQLRVSMHLRSPDSVQVQDAVLGCSGVDIHMPQFPRLCRKNPRDMSLLFDIFKKMSIALLKNTVLDQGLQEQEQPINA